MADESTRLVRRERKVFLGLSRRQDYSVEYRGPTQLTGLEGVVHALVGSGPTWVDDLVESLVGAKSKDPAGMVLRIVEGSLESRGLGGRNGLFTKTLHANCVGIEEGLGSSDVRLVSEAPGIDEAVASAIEAMREEPDAD